MTEYHKLADFMFYFSFSLILSFFEPPLNKCDKCERNSVKNYFCEFCTKNYCQYCTVKEAHAENVYCYEDVGCKNIHI